VSDWDEAYGGTPPWDIGRPQPVFLGLAESGALQGHVLDAGCGTGEHALMAAALGYPATGIDGSPVAIGMAEEKARERGLDVRFLVGDVLDMASLGERFDTILDMGLYHTFDDDQRVAYVDNLGRVTASGARFLMLCFSDRQPGEAGPRRVSEPEIRASFADGWRLDAIDPSVIETNAPGGRYDVRAWLVQATRS
jgi:cyclopropane fatty-acyl-phospholipid synthase-like methyltransferase